MAGGGGGERGAVSSEPNVVPMIDILLVLLIIFMITQPLSRMAIDVQVPPPENTTVTQQANNQPHADQSKPATRQSRGPAATHPLPSRYPLSPTLRTFLHGVK